MDAIRKLLAKISLRDRERLLGIVVRLSQNDLKGLAVQKIKISDLYRIRSGRFRIIFHYDVAGSTVIDSITLRNEHTYRRL